MGRLDADLKGHGASVGCLCALQDGRLASGSRDSTVRVWSTQRRSCDLVLKGHSIAVTSLCALADGRLASGAYDNAVRVWNVTTGNCEASLDHLGWVECVCALADGRIATGSNDNLVRVWNFAAVEAERDLKGHVAVVRCVCALSDGRLASGSDDCSIRVWNTTTGDCELELKGHTDAVGSVHGMSDGSLLSTSDDGSARIWSTKCGTCMETRSESRRMKARSLNSGEIIDFVSEFVCHTDNNISHALVNLDGSRLAMISGGQVMFASNACPKVSEQMVMQIYDDMHQFWLLTKLSAYLSARAAKSKSVNPWKRKCRKSKQHAVRFVSLYIQTHGLTSLGKIQQESQYSTARDALLYGGLGELFKECLTTALQGNVYHQ